MKSNNLPKAQLWTSYTLQALISAMFLMGAVTNLMQTEMAVTGAAEFGYPESSVMYLGVVLLLSTLLYVYPKTSTVGAILLTGWIGGAVATHVIHGDPVGQWSFAVVFGVLIWLAIWLRSDALKKIMPVAK